MKQQILRWWYSLAAREQRLLMFAAPLLLLGTFYWGLWQPLHLAKERNSQALQQLEQQRLVLQQLRVTSQQAVAPLQRSGSLAQIVSNSARSYSINVSRMQPQNEQLQLVLDDIAFEKLLPWLHQLQFEQGVRLVNLDVAAADQPGIVRVRRMVIE